MKVTDNYVSGDFFAMQSLSRRWEEVELDPNTFIKQSSFDVYQNATEGVQHFYTDLEDDRRAVVRFASVDDANAFKLKYESI